MDKVFVITVCRNAGNLLEATIQSVLHQTYKNLQYIIVDGGSTDGSTDIIKKYEGHLAAWVSEPDNGIYDAMNKGLRIANTLLKDGEKAWVNFMGAGDSFVDERVVAELFEENGLLNSAKDWEKVRVIGGNTKDYFPDGSYRIHCAEPAEVLLTRLIFSHQSCFVRFGTNLPNQNNKDYWTFNTKYKYAADYNLLHHLYKECGSDAFMIVNRVIACYRQEDSSSLTNKRRTKQEYLIIQHHWTSLYWWKEVIKFILHV